MIFGKNGIKKKKRRQFMMIKGAQKSMIVVKTAESRMFEEAYFVIRREARGTRGDMVQEADRIIAGCIGVKGNKRKADAARWIFAGVGFVCGGLAGGFLVGILTLFG
jgi:hypothetical protein